MGPLFAFATLFCWSLSDLIVKHAISKQSLWFVCFWGQLLGGIAILILGVLFGEIQSVPIQSWTWVGLLSVVNIVGMFFFYKAVQHKGVALSLPIIYSWSIPAIVLSMIFLQQYPTSLQWVGVSAAIIGLFLVSVDRRHQHWFDRGSLAAFLSMLTWGLFYFLITEPAQLYGEWWLTGMLKLGTAVLSLPFLFRESVRLSPQLHRVFLAVGLIGILDALGLVALSAGLHLSSTAVVTGITSTTPAIVAFFGVFLFKERVNLQQTLGIICAVIGLVLLVV